MTRLEDIPTHHVSSLSFSTYSSEEIRKLSVKQVTCSQAFDNLGHPVSSGLHDPVFGATDFRDVCHTCGLGSQHCPGHIGHIELPLTVFNPVYFKTMLKILKSSCFQCHHFNAPYIQRCLIIAQLGVLEHGLLTELADVQDRFSALVQEFATDSITEMDIGLQLAEFTANIIQTKAAAEINTRHILQLRQQLVTDFLKEHGHKSKCLYCKTRIPKLREDNNATVCLYNVVQKILQQNSESTVQHDDVEIKTADDTHDVILDDMELITDVADEEDTTTLTKTKGAKASATEKIIDQVYLSPVDCREHIRQLWKNDTHLLKVLFGAVEFGGECHGNIFFLDVIPVPPPRFRPAVCLLSAKFENAQTTLLSRVAASADVIRQVLFAISKSIDTTTINSAEILTMPIAHLEGDSLREKLHSAWKRLQVTVNCLLDENLNPSSAERKFNGIKQILEKKEGLFRKHMMGKRVDFAARSVISPDPSIKTNEVGMPMVFAKKLTYPELVTPWNVESLMEAVINGPNNHPGAVAVVDENGFKQHLSATDTVQREAVAKRLLTPDSTPSNRRTYFGCKQVYRHLKNGDVVLLNRQPTLHRPSIQAHMVRVLPGERTLRLHYANCNAYNADFDGDEMNAHFPQGQIARAEAYTIAATDMQYLVPKDGKPLAGLIQDHMIAGVTLTIRGRSFTRTDYQQLVFCALSEKCGRIQLLPPSIIKPCCLWSGKQVVSTLLINLIPEGKMLLSLTGKSKISEKNWQTGNRRPVNMSLDLDSLGESHVVIHKGELLCGVLDKGHYGPTPDGLVHSCYEKMSVYRPREDYFLKFTTEMTGSVIEPVIPVLYGGEVAGQLLTSLARLFTAFLQQRGFTLGVQDILVRDKANTVRHGLMEECSKSGRSAAQAAFGLDENAADSAITMAFQQAQFAQDRSKMFDLDLSMKSRTDDIQNQITKACMPLGLIKLFPYNNMQLMAQSGAKGSMVNTMQISCLLGQIELEGHRPPMMVSGSSLPSFLPYDVSPRAGGFVDGRFLTGIHPQEYFFHCMAGREGLVDTAVKTSRSGYLQRCIIKHLEGVIVNYDLTVRDSDGSVIQFYYGEDGLDVSKVQFLNDKQLSFIHLNKDAISQTHVSEHFTQNYHTKSYKKIEHWKKRNLISNIMDKDSCQERHSGFLKFCSKEFEKLANSDDYGVIVKNGRTKMAHIFTKKWYALDEDIRNKYNHNYGHCPDPVLSYKTPFSQLGILSEKMMERVDTFCSCHRQQANFDENEFRHFMCIKCMQSFAEPGEAVGLLAAQSIGEPSTQMTLNTFHFAGRGEMNVTLGIPRLREILMVASKSIKTPSMDIPVYNTSKARRRAKALQSRLNKVHLNEILQSVQVHERLEVKSKTHSSRIYRLLFNFLPYNAYVDQFAINPHSVLQYMEKFYFKRLCALIKKKMAYIAKTELLNSGSVKSTVSRDRQSDMDADEAIAPVNDDDNDLSDEEVNDNDDIASTRLMERHQDDAHDYQGEDDEKKDMNDEESDEEQSGLDDDGGEADIDDATNTTDMFEEGSVKMDSKLKVKIKKQRESSEAAANSRNNYVAGLHANIIDYTYDVKEELWCQIQLKYPLQDSKLDVISLIREDAPNVVIYQTKGITRAFLTEEKGLSEPQTHLKTEGINLMEMYRYDKILDLNHLYSNDIHKMAAVYGIEAAVNIIIQEIKCVFAAYGINVDYRHLSLIADYMTFEGSYKAFNRIGLMSNPSPLQKMTFETTVNFLRMSALQGSKDDLLSPSARIIAGRVVQCGTGGFELLYALS